MSLSFVCAHMGLRVCELFVVSVSQRREGQVCGGGFSWVSLNRPVSLYPESALAHLLTLSAHCHSNGVRERESPGKAKY